MDKYFFWTWIAVIEDNLLSQNFLSQCQCVLEMQFVVQKSKGFTACRNTVSLQDNNIENDIMSVGFIISVSLKCSRKGHNASYQLCIIPGWNLIVKYEHNLLIEFRYGLTIYLRWVCWLGSELS